MAKITTSSLTRFCVSVNGKNVSGYVYTDVEETENFVVATDGTALDFYSKDSGNVDYHFSGVDSYEFIEKMLFIQKNGEKYLYFNGKQVGDTAYSEVEVKDSVVYLTSKNGAKGAYIMATKAFIPCHYKEIWFDNRGGIAVGKDANGNTQVVFISLDGQTTKKLVADKYSFAAKYIIAKESGKKYGAYNYDGEVVVPAIFESLKEVSGDILEGERINNEGSRRHGYFVISQKKFVIGDDINISRTGIVEVLKDGEWFLLSK